MASLVNDTFVAPASAGKLYAGRSAMSGIGNARVAFWGQSNAIGRADQSDLSASPLSADAGLSQYMDGTLPLSRVFIWVPGSSAYVTLTAANNGASAGQFGPEFAMAVRWMRETVSGNLYIEKWASSGSSITASLFVPGVWPYTVGVGYRTSGNSWLSSNSITINHDAWVWWQGESDAGMSQETYQTHLETLMAGLTTDGLRYGSTPDVLIQMPASTAGYGAGPAAAKTAVAAANPTRTTTLTAAGYMKVDNLHQNGRGQVQTGYDIFERLYGAAHIST